MSKYTVFPHAPITEAVLDIKVEAQSQLSRSMLEKYHEKIKERFPEKQQRTAFKADIKFTPEGPTASIPSSEPDGYLFRSPAKNKIVQVRFDGFTFNKLKPYDNWDVFKAESQELWRLYYELTNPTKITRLALRYINRIEIPLPFNKFQDYILTMPAVSPLLPQVLSGFFMRLAIPKPELEATAIINETIENITDNQRLPLIFDIDVFREVNFTDNLSEIWSIFDKLRAFKNDIFFNSITEKTAELFK